MAIGIQAAQPGRQVVSLSGDGGFTMLMGDLITLTQMKLPLKVVIFNNGVLGFVALEMKAAGFVDTGVELQNPDFAAMATAMGIHAVRVEDPGDLPGAVEEMLAHGRPRAARRGHGDSGTVDAADHQCRASQGLQPMGATRRHERARRRSARSGQDKPVASLARRHLARPLCDGSQRFRGVIEFIGEHADILAIVDRRANQLNATLREGGVQCGDKAVRVGHAAPFAPYAAAYWTKSGLLNVMP